MYASERRKASRGPESYGSDEREAGEADVMHAHTTSFVITILLISFYVILN